MDDRARSDWIDENEGLLFSFILRSLIFAITGYRII